jgi:hypothetical protein
MEVCARTGAHLMCPSGSNLTLGTRLDRRVKERFRTLSGRPPPPSSSLLLDALDPDDAEAGVFIANVRLKRGRVFPAEGNRNEFERFGCRSQQRADLVESLGSKNAIIAFVERVTSAPAFPQLPRSGIAAVPTKSSGTRLIQIWAVSPAHRALRTAAMSTWREVVAAA